MQKRNRNGQLLKTVDDFADQIGAFIAIKQRRQNLNLKVLPQKCAGTTTCACAYGFFYARHIAWQVFKRHLQIKVLQNLRDRLGNASHQRVIGAVSALHLFARALDVFGTDGGAQKNKIVLKIAPLQYLRDHRVEKSLSQLGLAMVDQQTNVVQLGLVPHLGALRACLVVRL